MRLAIESERPVAHIAAELGLPAETLRKRVRQAEADRGLRPDLPSTADWEQIKELKREHGELRRANEILRAASLFCGRARREPTEVTAFIDLKRGDYGVEPICRAVGVSASADYQRATGARSASAVEDERLLAVILKTHEENFYAYGYRKMWKTLLRSGETAPASVGSVGDAYRPRAWRPFRPDRGPGPGFESANHW